GARERGRRRRAAQRGQRVAAAHHAVVRSPARRQPRARAPQDVLRVTKTGLARYVPHLGQKARAARWRSVGRPRVWAHRGASAIKPENTMAAFEAARAAKADGIELDVRFDADNT